MKEETGAAGVKRWEVGRWREGGGWDFKDERVRVTTLSGMPLSAKANICCWILLFPLLLFAVDRGE